MQLRLQASPTTWPEGFPCRIPQNPAPPSLPDAIKLAKELLADPKGPCAGLFKKGNGLSTLTELEKKGNIKVKDIDVHLTDGRSGEFSSFSDVGAATRGNKITINPNRRMAQGKGSGQFPNLSPLENYAVGIIHELLGSGLNVCC